MKASLDGGSPIYLQIKESIAEDILNGVLKPDEQIPSNRTLVNFYNVNPMTVMKGVGQLVDEGILYKKRGEGMFVAPDAQERLQKRFRENFRQEYLLPLVKLAVPLGIGLEELCGLISEIWREIHDSM